MQIRNGFVSNSSSQSFIVSTSYYKHSFDVGIAILRHIIEYNMDCDDPDCQATVTASQKTMHHLEQLQQNGFDTDTPIIFPTPYGETQIFRDGHDFFVNADRNLNLIEVEGLRYHDENWVAVRNRRFYFVHYGIAATYLESHQPCEHHSDEYMRIDGFTEPMCPHCFIIQRKAHTVTIDALEGSVCPTTHRYIFSVTLHGKNAFNEPFTFHGEVPYPIVNHWLTHVNAHQLIDLVGKHVTCFSYNDQIRFDPEIA